jgi:glycosyltransferase involved in cell wall biosynthesis
VNFPSVSILVPICNVEKYLAQCLDSLVNQTLREIEIICINDGSTDNSLSIIKEFAAKDKRIVIIDKPNSGYGDSMNQGLSIAKGEYIGIVESDDFADATMFEKLYNLTNNGSVDIVRSNYYRYWDTKGDAESFEVEIRQYEKVITLSDEPSLLLISPAIWSAIYRKDFLLKNDIRFLTTPGASYQDTSFFIKTLFKAQKIVYTKDKFLHYRQDNASSSVKQCSLQKAKYVHTELQECDKFLKKEQKRYEEIKRFYNTKKLKTYLWNLYRVDDKKGYLELMRNDSLEILMGGIFEKQYFSATEKIILQKLKNNSLDTICLLLKAKKVKQAIMG